MKIDRSTVEHIAHLSRLELNDTEKQEMEKDLGRILDFVDQLKELDTNNIEPLIYMSDERNVLRNDTATRELTQADALKNVPQKDSDYIKVPKVIES